MEKNFKTHQIHRNKSKTVVPRGQGERRGGSQGSTESGKMKSPSNRLAVTVRTLTPLLHTVKWLRC